MAGDFRFWYIPMPIWRYIYGVQTTSISITNIDELPQVATQILQATQGCKVFAFYAPMGAGKTTLIKQLCATLGSTDNFSSPTYSIVNEYHTAEGGKIYHMDLYRLKDTAEALAAGVEEYTDGSNYCFIEWPEVAEPLLAHKVVKINIDMDGNNRNVAIFMD